MSLKIRKKGLTEMGYRSDVAYTIRFSGEDDTKVKHSFYTFLAEAKANPETAGCFLDDEDHFKVVESAFTINFHATEVKWYEGYEDVKMHEALLAMARSWVDDGVDCIGYLFARIGEETNDTEEVWGGNWDSDWLYLKREIVKDW
jgi:hypothetical protein